jgi:hypothetical protein
MRALQTWSTWVKWNQSLEKSLSDAQVAEAGDASVDEAREQGKRGVLDVHVMGPERSPGRCWTLSAAELHQHFGSKRPTKKAIEAGAAGFIAKLGRGESVAVTAYLRALPCAVLFAGVQSTNE